MKKKKFQLYLRYKLLNLPHLQAYFRVKQNTDETKAKISGTADTVEITRPVTTSKFESLREKTGGLASSWSKPVGGIIKTLLGRP